jgi:hypothetical protein
VVHRPRLTDRLVGRDRPPLTLVSAPAWFGKGSPPAPPREGERVPPLVPVMVDAPGRGVDPDPALAGPAQGLEPRPSDP